MKLKTKKQQLRDKIIDLSDDIQKQRNNWLRMEERYQLKRDLSFFSFWIFDSAISLYRKCEEEKRLTENLVEYKEVLQDKLMSLNDE